MLVQAERVHRFKGGGVAARETNVGGSLGNERGVEENLQVRGCVTYSLRENPSASEVSQR